MGSGGTCIHPWVIVTTLSSNYDFKTHSPHIVMFSLVTVPIPIVIMIILLKLLSSKTLFFTFGCFYNQDVLQQCAHLGWQRF